MIKNFYLLILQSYFRLMWIKSDFLDASHYLENTFLHCNPLSLMPNKISNKSMQALNNNGAIVCLLVKRFICIPRQNRRNHLKLAICIMSQIHKLRKPFCMATLNENEYSEKKYMISSVTFHRTFLLMATGSNDKSIKLWKFSQNRSSATCVATLDGHNNWVRTVAFHPTLTLLATGSRDKTAKLWRFSLEDSNVTCVAKLWGHNCSVISVMNTWDWFK
jgi:WD40 repeat protein